MHTHTHTDLSCMYKLFHRVDDGLQCIVSCMSMHLRETGRSLVTEEPGGDTPGRNATGYIQGLLDLRDQYNVFLERSFSSDQLFKHAIAAVSGKHSNPQEFLCRANITYHMYVQVTMEYVFKRPHSHKDFPKNRSVK